MGVWECEWVGGIQRTDCRYRGVVLCLVSAHEAVSYCKCLIETLQPTLSLVLQPLLFHHPIITHLLVETTTTMKFCENACSPHQAIARQDRCDCHVICCMYSALALQRINLSPSVSVCRLELISIISHAKSQALTAPNCDRDMIICRYHWIWQNRKTKIPSFPDVEVQKRQPQ